MSKLNLNVLFVELALTEGNLKTSDNDKNTLDLLNQRSMLKDMIIEALKLEIESLTSVKAA